MSEIVMRTMAAGLIGILFFTGCVRNGTATADEIVLASLDAVGNKRDRNKIQNLVSFAECSSPNGKYSTEIHTASGGYSYFRQVYSYKPAVFEAVIENRTNGYSIADPGKPLSAGSVYTIRGHEFINMVLETDRRFHNFGEKEKTRMGSVETFRLKAKDELNHDCFLFIDVKTGLLSAIHLQNPEETKEIIKISFSGWKEVEKLLLPHQVTIDQGGKIYSFNFIRIMFNSPGFQIKRIRD